MYKFVGEKNKAIQVKSSNTSISVEKLKVSVGPIEIGVYLLSHLKLT